MRTHPRSSVGRRLAFGLVATFFTVGAGGALWLQLAEPLGDPAVENLVSYSAMMIAATALVVWLVLLRPAALRTRVATLAAVVVAIALFFVLFRLDSFSGDMVPRFAFRFGGDSAADRKAPTGGPTIDLRSTTVHDFPQFLGPTRSAVVTGVALARDWRARPPEELWRRPVGAGWSGFAVVNGFAVTMEQRGAHETVTCRRVATGEIVWECAVENRFDSILAGDGPRATPTVDDGIVYAYTNHGTLLAIDGATGTPRWTRDVRGAFGGSPEDDARALPYGRSNSPLVVDRLVIVPAGGVGEKRRSLVAYDKATGERVWAGGERQMSMSSPAVATLCGVRQVLVVNEDTAAGHDLTDGRVLWEHPWPGSTNGGANVSQPVGLPPSRVWLSKGYGLGASVIELQRDDAGAFTVATKWHERRVMRTKFTNVAIREGHAYGLSEGVLECVDVATGKRRWKAGRYRHGQLLLVDDLLLVLGENGEAALVEATPERANHVLGRCAMLEGKTWNTFALHGPVLLVRNATEAAAYRLPLAE